jgi:signal transduction histidine kinase
MLEDDFGFAWLGTQRGLLRVSKQELNVAADNGRHELVPALMERGCNGDVFPAACKTADGRLWFPTSQGVVVINPKAIARSDAPPRAVIEEVLADAATIARHEAPDLSESPRLRKSVAKPLRLPAGAARVLEFRYTAPSFLAPERIRFKYRLDGLDKEWIEAGQRRVAHYINLPAGQYVFRVAACNSRGLWSETASAFAFSLTPHFYQTALFKWSAAGALALLIIGMHYIRLRFERKLLGLKNTALLARERDRIARDMHDDLGARLTAISIMSQVAQKSLATHPEESTRLGKISVEAQGAVESLGQLVWATNPRHDSLENTCRYLREYTAKYLEPSGLRYHLCFPSQLPNRAVSSHLRHNLLLTFKEALNNAVKHARATTVTVTLGYEAGQLHVSIQDDGCGFSPNDQQALASHGLQNMRQRVADIGGQMTLESKPQGGSRICFSVPVSEPSSPPQIKSS